MIELAGFSEPDTARRHLDFAHRQLVSLSSPAYRAAEGKNGGFILKHSTGHWNERTEIDVPINYADYYFIEALMRLHKCLKQD